MLVTWRNGLYKAADAFRDKMVDRSVVNTKRALGAVERWYFFSRFSAYLFIETYCDILNLPATRESGLQYEGDSMTFVGGLFYVYGMDEEARFVQKHHRLPIDAETLEYLIADLQDTVEEAGGDDNFTKLETSLCAYEKFFKGSRYNGYYADRQLQELVKMRDTPEFKSCVSAVFEARKKAIKDVYRGEINGWDGIRPQLKKSYQRTGKILGLDR